MFNSKFKKKLKEEFNKEYNYEGDYAALASKIDEECGDVPIFNKNRYTRQLACVFSFACLIIVVLTIFITSGVVKNSIGNQKGINEYTLTEEEMNYVSNYVEDASEKLIYYVITYNKIKISVYKILNEEGIYYFVRIVKGSGTLKAVFNDDGQVLENGFYLLGISEKEKEGKNNICFICSDLLDTMEYIYDLTA